MFVCLKSNLSVVEDTNPIISGTVCIVCTSKNSYSRDGKKAKRALCLFFVSLTPGINPSAFVYYNSLTFLKVTNAQKSDTKRNVCNAT